MVKKDWVIDDFFLYFFHKIYRNLIKIFYEKSFCINMSEFDGFIMYN